MICVGAGSVLHIIFSLWTYLCITIKGVEADGIASEGQSPNAVIDSQGKNAVTTAVNALPHATQCATQPRA